MINLINEETGSTLVEDIVIQSTFMERLRGFAFYRISNRCGAMFFLKTKRVHTFGMLFPLNLYYFDASLRFITSKRGVRPNSLPISPKCAQHILEVPIGNSEISIPLKKGERISLIFKVRS